MSIALVTGGSRGIGRATVEAMLAEGWTVAFTYRSDESPAREIEAAAGGRAHGFVLDVRDRQRPGELVAEIERSIGPLDALVNNAGLRRESLLAMTNDRDWDEIMDVNLDGVFRCCKAVLPPMMHRRRGSIVNISSISAVTGVAGLTAYAASKAALLGMTRALAREVGSRGITVNCVAPGFIETDMTDVLPEAQKAALLQQIPLGRLGQASEVAHAVAFLASPEASYITGTELHVNGGMLMS